MLAAIDRLLGRLPKAAVAALASVLVLTLGVVDYLTGIEISFSISYLAPVALAAWYGGKRLGTTVSLSAGLAWLVADLTGGHNYTSPAIPAWNAVARTAFFLIVTVLTAKVRKQLLAEEQMADTDPLTGLANRRFFLERARFELERSKRYKRPFTLAYVDLDNFKAVNDTRGHAEGDTLLVTVADTMKSNVRRTDIAARLGGDEFAALLSDTAHAASKEALRKIQQLLLVAMTDNNWPVTFSIGVVSFEAPMSDIRDVMKSADDLMYEVKKAGKNRMEHRVWDGNVLRAACS